MNYTLADRLVLAGEDGSVDQDTWVGAENPAAQQARAKKALYRVHRIITSELHADYIAAPEGMKGDSRFLSVQGCQKDVTSGQTAMARMVAKRSPLRHRLSSSRANGLEPFGFNPEPFSLLSAPSKLSLTNRSYKF